MITTQLSLFKNDKRFNQDEFVYFIEHSEIPVLISQSLLKSFDEVCNIQHLEERRVKSDVMNTIFFTNLKEKLLENGIITTNMCYDSSAGNVKKHFLIGNYYFVLCKDGCTQNDTSITRAIEMQTCDRLVIQIQYTIDNSWSDLLAARFIYSEAGSAIFTYDIPLLYSSDLDSSTISLTQSTEVPTPTVSFKKSERNAINE